MLLISDQIFFISAVKMEKDSFVRKTLCFQFVGKRYIDVMTGFCTKQQQQNYKMADHMSSFT